MKKFKITTVCDCWTEYVVEAETLEEAKRDYADKHISSEDVDFRNEDIIDSECEEIVDEDNTSCHLCGAVEENHYCTNKTCAEYTRHEK